MKPIPRHLSRRNLLPVTLVGALLLALCAVGKAQSTATLQGRVLDPDSAVVPGARIALRNRATGLERIAKPTAKAFTRSRPCLLALIVLNFGSRGSRFKSWKA